MHISQKLVQDILRQASGKLTTKQEDYIVNFLQQDYGASYQELAKYLAKKLKADQENIYHFLINRDKELPRENDIEKRN